LRATPTTYFTPRRSRQRNIFWRQKPLSPRNTLSTRGHRRRNARTSSARIAQLCRAASRLLERR